MTSSMIIRRHKNKALFYNERIGNTFSLDMVNIPSGLFQMGAPENEQGSDEEERPQHFVNVSAFYMGKYPITQAQYMAITGENPSNCRDKPDSDRHPVENVRWEDANEFCKRLTDLTGRNYRLPSEAQWEYACRAEQITPRAGELVFNHPPFHFGKMISTQVANYDGKKNTYGLGEAGELRNETTPVGYFGVANNFGLYDMHGNVWEWCADNWHNNYKGAPTDGSVWLEGGNESIHPVRGGSWFHDPRCCRSAFRNYKVLDDLRFDIGFRVVCIPSEVKENPFQPLSGRIEKPEQFFNREKELQDIFDILNSGSGVELLGDRQIGKSSILQQIKHLAASELTGKWEPIYLNLQKVHTEAEFYESFCEELGIANSTGTDLNRVMRSRQVLLLLDEIEVLQSNGFTREIRDRLRAFSEDGSLRLVMAGYTSLDYLFPDSGMTSPLQNICLRVKLNPWQKETMRRFVKTRLERTGVSFSEVEMEKLWQESQGYPQKLMKACFDLYRQYS